MRKITLFKYLFLALSIVVSVHSLNAEKLFNFKNWDGNISIKGQNSFDQFGYKIVTGDVNGDGIDDVLCSAPSSDPLGRNSAGTVYLFYGEQDANEYSSIDLSINQADLTIYGSAAGDQLGLSIALGKLNNDIYADLVVSSPYNTNGGLDQCGTVYTINGSPNLPPTIDLATYAVDRMISGEMSNDLLGSSVTVADLNNDGIDELFMSAPFADDATILNCGKVYAVWSNETYTTTIDLASANNISYFVGASLNSNVGELTKEGNINNDSFEDLLIGAAGVDSDQLVNNGELYIVKGRVFFPFGAISLADPIYSNITIKGTGHSSFFGKSFACGDFNNDSNDDIVITDFNSQLDLPKVYVVLGGNGLNGTISLNSENAASTIEGVTSDGLFAEKLVLAHINSDLIDDIVICSPQANSANGDSSGRVYVIYGTSTLETSYSMEDVDYDELYEGESSDAFLGTSIAVSDHNNDSINDIWLGSIGGGSRAGRVTGVFGGIPWVWSLSPEDGSSNVDINQQVGFSISDNQGVDLNSLVINIAGTSYNINSNNLSYSGTPDSYRITVSPDSYFGYNQIIDVSITAQDVDQWNIPETNYRFYTREDTDPPFTDLWVPAPGDEGVAVETNVAFHIYDFGDGVDLSSIIVTIQGQNFYSGSPGFAYSGNANDYLIEIDLPNNFSFGEEVNVTIDASDLADVQNAMGTFGYSFTCGEDTGDPTLILISPEYEELVSRNHPIIIEVTDSESTINQTSIVLELDDVNILPYSQISPLGNGGVRLYYLPQEGNFYTYDEHEIHFYVEDNSSNSNSLDTLSVFTAIPDNEAPYTQNHFPAKFSIDNPTNTIFSVEILDQLSGVNVNSISVRINNAEIVGNPATTIDMISNGFRVNYIPPQRLVGTVSVEITAGDNDSPANIMPPEIYTFVCELDTEPPYITNLYPSEGELNVPRDSQLQMSILDNKTGVDISSLQIILDGVDVTADAAISTLLGGYNVLYLTSEIYDFDQWINVIIRCSDYAMTPNQYENNYNFRITADLISPELVDLSPEPNATAVSATEDIYFKIIDNGIGVNINSLSMRVNGFDVSPETTLVPNTQFYEVSYSHEGFDYAEQVSVVVSVSDLASTPNTLTNYNYLFTVVDDDVVEPIFTAFNPSPSSVDVPTDTSISLEILDADSGVNENSIIFKVNNITIINYTLEAIATTEGDGFRLLYQPEEELSYNETVNIQIYAMDNSSNNNDNSFNYSFTTKSDTEPPYISVSNPSDGGEGYANSILYILLKDDLSGIDKSTFALKINDTFTTDYVDSLSTKGYEIWYSTADFYEIDEVNVELSVSDFVGNNMESSYSFDIIPDIYEPYFLLLNDNLSDIYIGEDLEIAVLDKGVGIDVNSISLIINGKQIENYLIDDDTFNSNPDSLGYLLRYTIDDTFYAGQQLNIDVEASDMNIPDFLTGNDNFSIFTNRVLKKDKINIVPNIITLNNDGYNDFSRIIIPTSDKVVCKIFTLTGKTIIDIDATDYNYYDSVSDTTKQYKVAVWNGMNKSNKYVNAGLYICQVEYAGETYRNTIVIAK